jgi:hypothetical protein
MQLAILTAGAAVYAAGTLLSHRMVPMHHNFAGEVDRWGSKGEMILLPVIAWAMYLLITLLERFPDIWNTGIKITEENRGRAYRTLKNLIATMKLILVGVFVFLTVETALTLRLPAWFLPLTLGILFGDIAYWIWKLVRIK